MCNRIFLVNLPIANFAKRITLVTDTINHIVVIQVNLSKPHISLYMNVNGLDWFLSNVLYTVELRSINYKSNLIISHIIFYSILNFYYKYVGQ